MTTGTPPDRKIHPSWWARLRAWFQPRPPEQHGESASREPSRPAVDLLAPSGRKEREAWSDLRPQTFAECINQRAVIDPLDIAIQACKQRGEPLGNVLFYGPPGLGKTTFARIVADELGTEFRGLSGSALEGSGHLVSILTNLEEGDVLCIEAVHRLPDDATDLLCQAMSDFTADIVFDRGAHARAYRSRLPRFTIVGTTARIGAVPRHLRDHFEHCFEVRFYSADDMARLMRRSADLLEVEVEAAAAQMIAERSRGTPRVANRLLRRVRDYAQVRGPGCITSEVARAALALEGVDDLGLTSWDRAILTTLVAHHRGGPVSMRTLVGSLKREGRELADAIEPYLLASGLITRARRGVVATEKAYRHLGRAPS